MRTHLIALLSIVALATPCFADDAEQNSDPRILYNEAVRAMDAGEYDKACPMLEKITQALPDGLGAKFTLAECFEEQGQLGKAYSTFVEVEKASLEKGQTDRSQRAGARAKALRPKLGQISFTGSQSLVSGYGLRIEIDGVAIDSAEIDEPHYVDAGQHQIVAFAKDVRRGDSEITVEVGAVTEVSIRDLLNLPHRETPPSDASSMATTSIEPIQSPKSTAPKSTTRSFPIWQVVVGGLGLAAVGAGVAFKFDSMAAEKRLVAHCGEDFICPRNTAYDPAADNAQKNRSFGLFVGLTGAGAVAISSATLGLILRRSGNQAPKTGIKVQPTFSPVHGGMIVSGSF